LLDERTTIKLDILKKPAMKVERLVVSYGLWLGLFMGLGGLHRFYNGKIGTGLLWLFTWGFCGIGQLVDLFLIPNMSEEYELKLRAQLGVSAYGIPLDTTQLAATRVIATPSQQPQEKLMLRILKAARDRGGEISVTQAVLDTGADFEEVEENLKTMVKKGYARVDNHAIKGTVIYEFPEL
jgi:TM2 domain-containing membrane protein YozV/predicted transcriptional regulator